MLVFFICLNLLHAFAIPANNSTSSSLILPIPRTVYCRSFDYWLGPNSRLDCASSFRVFTQTDVAVYGSRSVPFSTNSKTGYIRLPHYYSDGSGCVVSVQMRAYLSAFDSQVKTALPRGDHLTDVTNFEELAAVGFNAMRKCRFGGEESRRGLGWGVAGQGNSMAVAIWGKGSRIDQKTRLRFGSNGTSEQDVKGTAAIEE